MREIKFRAWDKAKERMLPVCDISFGDDGSALTVIFQTAPKGKYYRGLVDGENGILMQFTGLTDENRQEIYEGDIVKWCAMGSMYIRSVQWDNDQAMFLPNHMKDGVEIIGNIYENPELVKAQ